MKSNTLIKVGVVLLSLYIYDRVNANCSYIKGAMEAMDAANVKEVKMPIPGLFGKKGKITITSTKES